MEKQRNLEPIHLRAECREALAHFEEVLQQRNLHLRTIHAYLFDAGQFLVWLENTQTCALTSITKSIANSYLEYLSSSSRIKPDGYAPATISRKFKSLQYFYDSLRSG
jgi:site-specific recombinase XerD